MAITGIDRGDGFGYSTNPSIGDTFTPTEDNVIVVTGGAVVNDWTGVTGWSISFSEILAHTSGKEFIVFAGIVGASPGSDQAQMTLAGGNWAATVTEISGLDVSGTVNDIFVQSIASSVYDPTDPYVINTTGFASAFSDDVNGTMVVPISTYGSNTFSPQTGFSEISANVGGNMMTELHLYDGEEQDPEISGYVADTIVGGLAFEIAGAVATGPSISLMRRRGR